MTREVGTALVIVLAQVESDPRVRRQIDWLHTAGWTVDTIGLGPHPAEVVRDHFAMAGLKRWVRSRWGAILVYVLLPLNQAFRRLAIDRIPNTALCRIREGQYDLIVFDDIDLIPLVKDRRVFTTAARRAHIHLDIHEYREKALRRTPWRVLTSRYYRWVRGLIADPAFTTRSTVAVRIAEAYGEEFGIEPPVLVRSIPPYRDLQPSPTVDDRIELIHHGLASWQRGFIEILDAMRLLDDRFRLTFMLTGSPTTIAELGEHAADLGERVKIVPAVPMDEVSSEINKYDVEIIFIPPVNTNLKFALPNKLFEAVQGRLGLVVGESPMMAEIVDRYGMGLIVTGWTGVDLAAALRTLTTEKVREFKANSDRAALELNAEAEGNVFLATISAGRTLTDRPAVAS